MWYSRRLVSMVSTVTTPKKNPHAVLYDSLSYKEVVSKNLKVMDATAIALCQEHQKPILVFNFKKDGNIVQSRFGR